MMEMRRGEENETATAIPWGAGGRAELARPAGQETLAAWITRELTAAWRACGAFEWVALGYLGASSLLIAALYANLAHPLALLAVQTFAAAIIMMLCGSFAKTEARAENNGVTWASRNLHFWRHWYPHLFFLFCFEELGHLVHLVFPGWFDPRLIAFDHWLTGVHPTVWLERFSRPLLNDFMQFAYITYFLYLLVLGGILYARKDWHAYWAVMTYSMVGYAIGYVIAIFFPIQSPWFSMAGVWHGELNGGFFTGLINLIEHCGRVRGAAFPSEHVAGAIAALWGARSHCRRLFWIFLPLVLCMMVSTVYGRYHYVADVLAGMVTGTLGYWLGAKLMKVRGAFTGDVGQ